jgi:segregation and condensation protein B
MTADPVTTVAGSVERRLEALLMVADEPQSLVDLATAVGEPVSVVRRAVEALVADFDGVDGGVRRGFELREVGVGWRFYVREEHDPVVRDFVMTQNPSRLSQAALETLAVIAYKQPITRSSIAQIRAVNVDSVVRTLLGRGLVTESRDGRHHLRNDGTPVDPPRHQLARRAPADLPAPLRRIRRIRRCPLTPPPPLTTCPRASASRRSWPPPASPRAASPKT